MVNYTLTIEAPPISNGSTDPAAGAHVYAEDTVVTVTATPDAKQEFRFFITDGVQSFTNPLVVTMTEDMTVTPHFAGRHFMNVIRSMEKVNLRRGDVFEPYVFVPGIFGSGPFDDVLARLER